MITFKELMNDPTLFKSFVRELAPAFKEPRFPMYAEEAYSETRDWKGVAALNGRIPMASLVDPYSGKPVIGSEKPLDMEGELPTFGNIVSFTSKEYARIGAIERAIADGVTSPEELIKYLNSYFERLAVGPRITVDKLFFETFSNGTATITAADNLSGLSMSINWGIPKQNVSTVWSTAASATGIDDLEAMYNYMKNTHGIILDKFTMNRNTFTQLQAQASTKAAISSYFAEGGTTTKYTGTPSLEAVNKVLISGRMLPPIQIEEYQVAYYNTDGITVKKTESAFLDGRVTGTVGEIVGSFIWTPSDEQRMPDVEAVYQDVNHVMISKRTHKGKITFESELNGIVVPTMMEQMGILITDATE